MAHGTNIFRSRYAREAWFQPYTNGDDHGEGPSTLPNTVQHNGTGEGPSTLPNRNVPSETHKEITETEEYVPLTRFVTNPHGCTMEKCCRYDAVASPNGTSTPQGVYSWHGGSVFFGLGCSDQEYMAHLHSLFLQQNPPPVLPTSLRTPPSPVQLAPALHQKDFEIDWWKWANYVRSDLRMEYESLQMVFRRRTGWSTWSAKLQREYEQYITWADRHPFLFPDGDFPTPEDLGDLFWEDKIKRWKRSAGEAKLKLAHADLIWNKFLDVGRMGCRADGSCMECISMASSFPNRTVDIVDLLNESTEVMVKTAPPTSWKQNR